MMGGMDNGAARVIHIHHIRPEGNRGVAKQQGGRIQGVRTTVSTTARSAAAARRALYKKAGVRFKKRRQSKASRRPRLRGVRIF